MAAGTVSGLTIPRGLVLYPLVMAAPTYSYIFLRSPLKAAFGRWRKAKLSNMKLSQAQKAFKLKTSSLPKVYIPIKPKSTTWLKHTPLVKQPNPPFH